MSKFLVHLLAGLLLVWRTADLSGATYTWNGQSSTSGPSDGSATWNQSNGNKVWWNGTSRVSWTDGNDAIFGSTTSGNYTITIGANLTVQSLTFNLSTYTIGSSANTFTLSSGNATVASGVNSTINQAISGSSGFTKLGVGTLTLGGANNYSGTTTISAGTLRLSIGTAIPDSSAVSITSGATFDLNGNSETVGSLSGAGSLSLGSGLLTAGGLNTSSAYSGVINGSGGRLTKLSTGTLTLSGANTYTGATTVSAGVIDVQNNTALGTAAGSTSVASGAALQVDGNGLIIAEPINTLIGTGISSGGALRNLANNNTWSGAITLGAGGARINSDSGTLTLSGNISGAGQPVTVGGSGNVTISGAIGTTTGALTKDGSGTLTLTGANSFTGGTTLTAGTLALGANDRLADIGAVNVAANTTFSLGGFSETIGALSGAGNVSLGSGTLTAGDATSTTFSGVISGSNGNFTKAGSGTLTLSGANTYTGATVVSAGTLRLGASGALHDSSAVSISGGATLDLNSNNETIGSLAGSGNVTLGAGNLTTGGNNASTTHSGVVSGAGGLTKTGTGTFILAGNNTYTGPTAVNAGVLRVAGITTGSILTVNNGGTVSGTGTIADFMLASGGTVSPGASPGTLNTGSQTWSGGANYTWEINQANGTKGSDPGWDFLNIGGTLTINASSGSKFNVAVTSLALGGGPGSAVNFDNSQNYAWTIATASGGITGFDSQKFNLDVSAFQNELGGGSFGITQSGNDVSLTFSAVPEPHEYRLAAAAGLLGFAAWRRWKLRSERGWPYPRIPRRP